MTKQTQSLTPSKSDPWHMGGTAQARTYAAASDHLPHEQAKDGADVVLLCQQQRQERLRNAAQVVLLAVHHVGTPLQRRMQLWGRMP